ncbi:hypothetical protein [Pseudomonas sp. 51_B]|uniref:hypothetical protein n=1 Tax=Pseudomonas sp. 51_B TaxID=2813573 RepID=UPI001A9D6301|nr:hypothetical protein [Pseudomonas sp. 51_B]
MEFGLTVGRLISIHIDKYGIENSDMAVFVLSKPIYIGYKIASREGRSQAVADVTLSCYPLTIG